jgi:hypothetical protein
MRFTTYRGEKTLEDLAKRIFGFSGSEKPELVNAVKDALLDANPQLRKLENVQVGSLLVVPDLPGSEGSPAISQLPLDGIGLGYLKEALTNLGNLLSRPVEERQTEIGQYIERFNDRELSKRLEANSEIGAQLTSQIDKSIEEAKKTKTEIESNLETWRGDVVSLIKDLETLTRF